MPISLIILPPTALASSLPGWEEEGVVCSAPAMLFSTQERIMSTSASCRFLLPSSVCGRSQISLLTYKRHKDTKRQLIARHHATRAGTFAAKLRGLLLKESISSKMALI